jgi:hypothetical protein
MPLKILHTIRIGREGIIELYNSTASVTWLENGEAEPLIDEMKLKEKQGNNNAINP